VVEKNWQPLYDGLPRLCACDPGLMRDRLVHGLCLDSRSRTYGTVTSVDFIGIRVIKQPSLKSIKEGNRLYVGAVVLVNALLLYTISQSGAISISGLKALFTESTNLLPVGLALIVTTVANGLLSSDLKARLVFLKWRHALPGHRAFSQYAPSDPRVHLANLRKVCGDEFPSDPVQQNRTWYRLYKTVEHNSSVEQVQRDFLLTRDYTGLAALFVVTFGPVALFIMPSWRVSLLYCLSSVRLKLE
jgi:hypothetical protein